MFAVIALFVINIFFCLWNPRYTNSQAKTVYWLLCVVAIFVIGFRGEIDNDYATYEYMFDSNYLLVEPTFVLIRYIVRDLFGGGIVGLMLIYAVIGVTLKFKAISRYSDFIFPSLAVWIGNLMILQDMTQIRAAAACGLLLLAIGPLYERDWKRYFWLVFLAVMFHMSALLMVPLWFLKGKRINRGLWTAVVPLGYALSLAGIYATSLIAFIPIETVQSKFLSYDVETTSGGGASIFGIFQMTRVALFLLLLWNAPRLVRQNRYAPLLLKIMACGLAALPLFRNNIVAGLRITELLTCVDILLFPMLIYLFPRYGIGKWMVIGYSAAILFNRLFMEELLLN